MQVNFYTPVVTAFDETGALDMQGNKNIYDYLINGGISGLLILGSSGEFYALRTDQKRALIDMAVPYINRRAKVFFGTACDSMAETIELSNYALKAGADGIMLISPYYFTLEPAAIEAFYDKAADSIKGPLYIYNFPDRTGYDVSPKIVLRLLNKHRNIVGLKDSVANMGHTREMISTVIKDFPEFQVYSGFDENLLHNAACGGAGCIGALSNVFPKLMIQWQNAVNSKDWNTAFALQKKADRLMELYDINPYFISTLKRAMILQGVQIKHYCQKPALDTTPEEIKCLQAVMASAK